MGGPIEDERTFRMIFSLLFFDGWWVLQNSLFSVPVVVCCRPPPPPASGKLWHICVEQPRFYRHRNAASFQISDVTPYMCVISCSWRQDPYVFYISHGYFWVTEKWVYWIRQSNSGFVGKKRKKIKSVICICIMLFKWTVTAAVVHEGTTVIFRW